MVDLILHKLQNTDVTSDGKFMEKKKSSSLELWRWHHVLSPPAVTINHTSVAACEGRNFNFVAAFETGANV